jgi:hypothetical protein
MIALPYITDTALIMILGVVPLLRHDVWTEGRTGHSDTGHSDTGHSDSAARIAQPLPAV